MKKIKAHPLVILSYIYPYLFVLIIPVARAVLKELLDRRFTSVLVAECVIFAAVILNAVIKWLLCEIIVFEDSVKIKTGFIIRKTLTVSKKNISALSFEQSPLDALFGALTLRLDTEAGKRGRSDFAAKIKKADAKALYPLVGYESKRVYFRISGLRVLLLSAATSSAGVGLLISAPILNKAGKLLDVGLTELLLERVNTAAESQSLIPPVVNAAAVVFAALYLFSFIVNLIKNMRMSVELTDGVLAIKQGVLRRRKTCFRAADINSVTLDQNPAMRLFGRYLLRCGVAGYGGGRGESASVLPAVTRREAESGLFGLFGVKSGGNKKILPKSGELRFIKWQLASFFAIPAAAYALCRIFPAFDDLAVFLSLVATALCAYRLTLREHDFRREFISVGDGWITAHASAGFNIRETAFRRDRIGKIRIRRRPVDRRRGSCTVTLTAHSETAESITVRFLDYQAVRELLEKGE